MRCQALTEYSVQFEEYWGSYLTIAGNENQADLRSKIWSTIRSTTTTGWWRIQVDLPMMPPAGAMATGWKWLSCVKNFDSLLENWMTNHWLTLCLVKPALKLSDRISGFQKNYCALSICRTQSLALLCSHLKTA